MITKLLKMLRRRHESITLGNGKQNAAALGAALSRAEAKHARQFNYHRSITRTLDAAKN